MIKKQDRNEIDLLEIFLIIWKDKWKVILITALAIILTFVLEKNKLPQKLEAKTEIRLIGSYEDGKYNIFNSYIDKLSNLQGDLKIKSNEDEANKKNNQIGIKKKLHINESDLRVIQINRYILYDLFFDYLNQKSFLSAAIKKFNLLKKENFNNTQEYELAVSQYASSIVVKKKDGYSADIEIRNYNLENWEFFLEFFEKEINQQVRSDIKKTFDNYLDFSQKMKEYEIEDIDIKLSNISSLTDEEILELEREKKILEVDQYFKRFRTFLQNSPIYNSDNFYAAKIIYDSTEYKRPKNSMFKKPILVGILTLIFTIIIVLISHGIKSRKF